MSKTAKHLEVQERHIYHPEVKECPHCDEALRARRNYKWRKTVQLTMPEKIKDVQPPRDLARLAWRAPIWFYRLGLGGLLGERFVLLNHTGRKSGQPRQTVLEVVRHDAETGAYIVASGFGEKSDWYQNVMAHPEVTIQVGRKRMAARAERLALTRATNEMLDYNRRYPAMLRNLAGLLGYRSDGSEADARFFAGVIPILALTPFTKA